MSKIVTKRMSSNCAFQKIYIELPKICATVFGERLTTNIDDSIKTVERPKPGSANVIPW